MGWGRKEVLLHPFFLSVLCFAESVLHVSFCLAAGAQLYRDLFRGLSENWAASGGLQGSLGWRREGLSG